MPIINLVGFFVLSILIRYKPFWIGWTKKGTKGMCKSKSR